MNSSYCISLHVNIQFQLPNMELFNLKLIMTVCVIYILGFIGAELCLEEPHGELKSSKDIKTGRINSKSVYNKYLSKINNVDYEPRSIIPGKCNSIIKIYEGEVHYMFSDSFSGTTTCNITYKSPAGTILNAFCPVVDLDKKGCMQESLLLKSSPENRVIGCYDYGELNLFGTTNRLTLKYKRKDSRSSPDVRGYFCMISIQSESQDFVIGNFAIKLCMDEVSYQYAKSTCDYIGQGLFSFDTQYINILTLFTLACNGTNAWAPFTDEITEGSFLWDLDGSVVNEEEIHFGEIYTTDDGDCIYYHCGDFYFSSCDGSSVGIVPFLRLIG